MKTIIFSFTSLIILWLLLSGYFKTNLIVLGILSCGFVTYLSIKLKIYSSNHERIKFNLHLPLYIPWLLKEIVKSNLHVARCILSSSDSIQPQTICSKPSQKTNTGLAVHANSITLTPGTISVDINDNEILVHALTDHTAKGITNGDIDKRVSKLEDGIN
ncbi:MAG: Na+/H+ antiporter subunit E [Gammaproteobacteria bacterium]|nr:Na+/H+ antiporter subunit E [Gammaproteobacteria bacterium]